MRLPLLPDTEGEVDVAQSARMIDWAMGHGVNYYDSAYTYLNQKSESIVGEILSGYHRDRYYLATKMPTWLLTSDDDLPRFFEEQLRRCRTDYFDFYLAHNLNVGNFANAKKYRTFAFLEEMRREGKIRRLGFSYHGRPDRLPEVLEAAHWEFAQIQVNYIDWEGPLNARGQYELLTEQGLPIVVMEPVRGGVLAGLPDRAADLLRAGAPGQSAAAVALRFVGQLPGVMTVLSGMSTMAQVEENVDVFSPLRPLSDRERAAVDEVVRFYRENMPIPCTACRYCLDDCPQQIAIPELFANYNHYMLEKGNQQFFVANNTIPAERRADRCIGCGACAAHCPQGIDIPGYLEKTAELAKVLQW